MKVGEIIAELQKYPNDVEVITKKTEFGGNVAFVNSIRNDSFSSYGFDIPCVLLTDEYNESEE